MLKSTSLFSFVWLGGLFFSSQTGIFGASPSAAAQQQDGQLWMCRMVMVRTVQMGGKKKLATKDTYLDPSLGRVHVGITQPRTVCVTFKLPFLFSS